MHKRYPDEFRRDVIAVARQGGQTRAQIARSFGISESCLGRWLKIADREDGLTAPTSPDGPAAESDAELRELRRRNKLLEQENEMAVSRSQRNSSVSFFDGVMNCRVLRGRPLRES